MSRADANLALMRTDDESDWPSRLLGDISGRATVSEADIGRFAQRAASPLTELTATESAALKAASHGMSRKETGVLLGASELAIGSRWREAQRKLRAKNTTQACCEAIRQGLIP